MQDFEYLEPEELVLKLEDIENRKKTIIVDVREDDFVGGYVKGALHIPSYRLQSNILDLIQKTENAKEIIFYCSLSQKRGPAGARLFLKTLQQIKEKRNMQKNSGSLKVYVLKGGFTEWQKKYGKNEKLTEEYDKNLWEEK
ncbi:hypothetical protein PORY_002107 [Pneumocystis oryctolagi]|uniref:Uncharacterized protein n=1 Tax=Pneumocystis oryctolagi TaxID=42067 RepID=A0ACB7C9L3_9ASCO|nr:hypothetical protein PORY_002107 [Pneumocystis oryctolagi]